MGVGFSARFTGIFGIGSDQTLAQIRFKVRDGPLQPGWSNRLLTHAVSLKLLRRHALESGV
ncbi:MAG: hypothetical protein IH971_07935 [Candidatus Marinimicrobia bacterium]|nr:hypothetical protein [Candidatus Neomarinimicrobiota bacterium]